MAKFVFSKGGFIDKKGNASLKSLGAAFLGICSDASTSSLIFEHILVILQGHIAHRISVLHFSNFDDKLFNFKNHGKCNINFRFEKR